MLSRWMGVVLVTTWARLASAQPPSAPPDDPPQGGRPSVCDKLVQELSGYRIPGRAPNSEMPWEFFLGNASHQLIAYIYGTRYPSDTIYTNRHTLRTILQEQRIGNWSLLTKDDQLLRPDITNVSSKEVFEIKPLNPNGLQNGLQKLEIYMLALNQTLPPAMHFSAGAQFEGEVLVQFAQGQYIWHLEWCTNTPGVTQYRWTRTSQRFDSSEAAYHAGQWVELSEQDLKQYGAQVSHAVEGMVDRRHQLGAVSGVIGLAIDLLGEAVVVVLSSTIADAPRSTGSMGKVLPFPARVLPRESLPPLPKASGL